MRGILETSIQFRFLIVVLAIAFMLFGIIQLGSMPIDLLPEFSPTYIEIQTEALGLSAEEVEQFVTVPLEQDLLNGVAWLDKIRSESVSGLSSITLIFEPGTDLYRARQMVAERLAQAAVVLPRVSKSPVMLQPTSSTSRVLVVGLSSKSLSAIQMSVLARWTITPRVMGVPGVANVAIWGMRDRQLQVQVDPERLRAYNVSLLQLIETVGNALWVSTLSFVEASSPGNAGFIDTPQQRLGIQHISPITSPESLAQVTVPGRGTFLVNEAQVDMSKIPMKEGAVRLIDVADVVESHQPLIGDARLRDGASLLLVIEKLPGSDPIKVTRGVEDALDALRPGLGGMEIDSTIFRPATFVALAGNNVVGIVAALLGIVVLFLGLFFFNGRVALIGLVTIPLSMLAAGLILYLRGATLNMYVLIGLVIALGVMVDDLIIDVEWIMRKFRQRKQASAASVIIESLLETRSSMLFATLVGLLAVLPAFSFQETVAAFFQPLAIAYMLAGLVSMFVALTIVPALYVIFLSSMTNARRDYTSSPFIRWVQARYDHLLNWMLSKPQIAFVMLAALAVIGLGALSFIRPRLFPTFKEPELLVHLETAPGTSQTEMVRLVDRVTRELGSVPGVRNVGALVGRAVFGDQVVGVNSAQVLVKIAPSADYLATITNVEAIVNGYPGVKGEVQTYLKQTTNQAQEAGAPIVVRIYGQDWTILSSKAEELRQAISGIAGVGDSRIAMPIEEPTLEVEVNLLAAQRHGINPGNVRRAASTLIKGLQVGSLFQEQKVFDVVVWSTPETRGSLTDIRQLLIDTPFFQVPVRLEDVAQVRIVPRPSVIHHENVSRYVDISLDMNGRDAGAIVGDIKNRLRQFQFPLEYHAQVLGSYEQQQSAQNQLLTLVTVALIGILLLLQAAFDSWRLAILSFLTLPLALVGGLVALAVVEPQSVSLGAIFGLLTVFGIAARHQIMLIRDMRQAESNQEKLSNTERILFGARQRFVPVLMMTLTIVLALVPALLLGDTPGLEILRPTAIVILGGMLTCTFVDLLVVPTLYVRLTQ